MMEGCATTKKESDLDSVFDRLELLFTIVRDTRDQAEVVESTLCGAQVMAKVHTPEGEGGEAAGRVSDLIKRIDKICGHADTCRRVVSHLSEVIISGRPEEPREN